MSNEVKVKVAEGAMEGQCFAFDEHDMFVFGRAQGCHARLPDDSKVSRHHFIMEVNPPRAVLRDLGSLNGTYVNGVKHGGRKLHETPEQGASQRHAEVTLQDGDIITVGETVLHVRLHVGTACSACGGEIAFGDQAQSLLSVGHNICSTCAARLPSLIKAAGPAKPPRCDRCGKDVVGEIGGRRGGHYVCQACREEVADDPARLLSKLLNVAQREIDRRGPPPIKGYEIKRKIGLGGFGAVYLAHRAEDSRPVAIKIMLSRVAVDEGSRKRFLREISILEGLRHENIVPLLDHGSTGTAFYFIMDYCAGGSVGDLMKSRGGKLPIHEAREIALSALAGLTHAHSSGIVHRDLKPANVLLSGSAGSGSARVADFGLARSFEKVGLSGMTVTGSYAGTFPFMPREQVTDFKHSKPYSDVWSLAATFYNMLTGLYPHDFPQGVDPMEVVLGGKPIPIRNRNPRIPRELADVVDQALAMMPSARYPSASEFREALQNTR